ncbi:MULTISPECIES: ABC transporter substrate-binding protein [Salinivibrio]|uniref:Putrescine-binding periplasmic protein n=1 Tax=Salinivibrio kushneri TaxID=1908198 RepID=A0AB36JS18_9GAMM|nr:MULTISPECIES: spermidine/putrescine ABC transporter substrate-binding protein [Salinivibrio]ODP97478.1 spermidine/putrescine ABC transporter substrate-binding protein [Salinivibrio sp. BNH]OOE36012.1 spermidine/putrescine ABC transporter substrate-binding protein [Salinivibrio kushneri]OOE38600.1 spermidine/putrescine ABC transporter substrate-binding protein [Salinivibrio kushneri]OOE46073.1 spermidine/putrescine ABC transporter substrate-binding protein [Salinivibrio kushneri]OOE50255.1 s
MKKMSHGITATTLALSALFASAVHADDKVLNLYNWAEYMPMDVIEAFEEEYQVDVNYSTFESNEAMYAKLKLLNSEGYDLAFASTYFIERMVNEEMLANIDKSQISHFDNLRPGLLGQPFDKNNDYSLPYVFGVTGISYNSDYVDGSKVAKWADLWRDDFNGQVMLLNDVRDVFGMALKAQGHSINSTEEAEIKQAYEYLRELRDNVVVYNSDAPHVPFVTGEVSIGQQWNGNAYMAQQEIEGIEFVYPQEGAILWMDNFIIPKNAEHKTLAHQFIDFMYRPENQAKLVEEFGYPAPNTNAAEYLEAELKENSTIFPSDEAVNKGEFTNDVGEAVKIYQKYWQMLKS